MSCTDSNRCHETLKTLDSFWNWKTPTKEVAITTIVVALLLGISALGMYLGGIASYSPEIVGIVAGSLLIGGFLVPFAASPVGGIVCCRPRE